MNKVSNVLICGLILAGFPLLAWSGYSLAADTYALWTRGVEKHASVVRLEGVRTGRGGTTFDYAIEIDGKRSRQEFRARLRISETVDVLVVPDNPRTIALGNKSSSPFAIFSSLIGGQFNATIVVITFAFVIVATPAMLWRFMKGGKAALLR